MNTLSKKEIIFKEHLKIANDLKSKEYKSETDLIIEILASGLNPKAIIILSFFNALKAKRMLFNKHELAKRLKISEYSSQRYSKELIELGLLKREVEHSKEGNKAYYSTIDFKIKNTSDVLNEIKNYTYKPPKIDIVEITPQTSELEDDMKPNEPLEAPKIDNSSDLLKKDMKHFEEIKEIIDYLNLKAGKKFRYDNKSNNKHITARLKDGYTIEDLKSVVDLKCKDWLNNDKMVDYLRPETLFNSSKFENYYQNISNYTNESGGKVDIDIDMVKFRIDNLIEFFRGRKFKIKHEDGEIFARLDYIGLDGQNVVFEYKNTSNFDDEIVKFVDIQFLNDYDKYTKLRNKMYDIRL